MDPKIKVSLNLHENSHTFIKFQIHILGNACRVFDFCKINTKIYLLVKLTFAYRYSHANYVITNI